MSIYRLPRYLITDVVYTINREKYYTTTREKYNRKKKEISIPTIYQDYEPMIFDFENTILVRIHTLLKVVSVFYNDIDLPSGKGYKGTVNHLFTLERL